MKLIIGGAGQGKTCYAMDMYGLHAADIATVGAEDYSGYDCIDNFHEVVRELLRKGLDPLDVAAKIVDYKPDVIIIMNEIGCGIVPLDKEERALREAVGRVGCYLAGRAESVERLTCGIVTRIK